MKRRVNFFATFLLLHFYVVAQTKLTIIYKLTSTKDSLTYFDGKYELKNDSASFYIEYTINDSIDFVDVIGWQSSRNFNLQKIKEKRKNIILGKSFGAHRNSNNYQTKIRLEGRYIYWQDKTYILIDSIKNNHKKWVLTNATKTILGYPCKQALMIKDDKVFEIAWYTNAFNCNFSEDGDLGLDGIILETFLPKTNGLYTAVDIDKNAKPIIYPKYKKRDLLTREQFDRIQ